MKRIQKWVLQKNAEHPVLLVRYEDLKSNTIREVERMLVFLQRPFDADELSSRLAEDFTTFKRPHYTQNSFERYTSTQRLYMDAVLLQGIEYTQNSNMTHVLKLNEYLRSS